jgi:plastocyanin
MYRFLIHSIAMLLIWTSLATPAAAGGMATVHLDAPPQNVVAGVPLQIGFMVMQHDITPVNLEKVYISARHRESGETYQQDARQEGEVGHYLAELTFPAAGSWKWQIIPEPFAGTSFESITVQAAAGDVSASSGEAAHPAHIHTGSCAALGEVQFPLSDVLPGGAVLDGKADATSGTVGFEEGEAVAISTTTLNVTIAELLSGPHAINIHKSAQNVDAYVACGNVSGRMVDGSLIVGLQQLNGSSDVGIAVLREEAERTTVSLYMLVVESQPVATGPEQFVVINGSNGNWFFEPARIEIAAGTTVTWENKTEAAHTVMSDNLAFEDSGPFGPGETFSAVFTEPGTYAYRCGPHPPMTGTIVVK